ncbi:MAG TPA: hypothetical protein DIT07_03695 [Sphingobacteriaceae bacterium]|nr:hypothetical protein [Sphingobacteriaceae bacterium]
MKRFSAILFFISVSFTFCTKEGQPDNSSKAYFDLKGFFKNEAEYLQKKNPLINKTIAKNDLKESKKVSIRNWVNELELFAASDINKSAWKDLYEVKNSQNSTQYLAKDGKLRTRKIIIDKSSVGKIKHIFILNQVANNLYSSTEELNYYPDSLYSIRKKQKILIIGDNNYSITGDLPAHDRIN